MASEHAELVAEMAALERMQLAERMKQAKKRRAQQLKVNAQYEKQLSRETGGGGRKGGRKGAKVSGAGVERARSGVRIRFASNVLLLDAAANKDKEEVQSLLRAGLSPDMCNDDGLTTLHQCCIDNLDDIVRLLLQFGADPNARDSECWTPLHAAAACGHPNLCRQLCDKGAKLLAMNVDGNMPYDLCEDVRTLNYIESEMAKAGITQEQIDATRLSPERAMLADLKVIAGRGGSLEGTGRHGETPLHVAACNGYVLVTEFLLERRVAVDARDNDDWQPIHCAACWGQLSVAEILIGHGADVEALSRSGESAIDLCEEDEVRNQILAMVDEIVNKVPRRGKTPRGARGGTVGGEDIRRGNTGSRRLSNVNEIALRHGGLHDRSALSHRDIAQESQRLQDAMAAMTSLPDEDEDDPAPSSLLASPPVAPPQGALPATNQPQVARKPSDVQLQSLTGSTPANQTTPSTNSSSDNRSITLKPAPNSALRSPSSNSMQGNASTAPLSSVQVVLEVDAAPRSIQGPAVPVNAGPAPVNASPASSALLGSAPASVPAGDRSAVSGDIGTCVQQSSPASKPVSHQASNGGPPGSLAPPTGPQAPPVGSQAPGSQVPGSLAPGSQPPGSQALPPPPSGSLAALKLERARRLQGTEGKGNDRPPLAPGYSRDINSNIAADVTVTQPQLLSRGGSGEGGGGRSVNAIDSNSTRNRFSNLDMGVESDEGKCDCCCCVM